MSDKRVENSARNGARVLATAYGQTVSKLLLEPHQVADLIADIAHYAHSQGMSAEEILENARDYFLIEKKQLTVAEARRVLGDSFGRLEHASH